MKTNSLVPALVVAIACLTACGPSSEGSGGPSHADPPDQGAAPPSDRARLPTDAVAMSASLHVAIGDAGESVFPTGTKVDALVTSSDHLAIHGVASSASGLARIEMRGDVATVCVRTDDGGTEEESTMDFDLYAPDSAPEVGVATTRTTNAAFDVAPFTTCRAGWSFARLEGTVQAIAIGANANDIAASGVFAFHMP